MLVRALCMEARYRHAFSLSLGTEGSLTHRVLGVACHATPVTPPVTQNELMNIWKVEIDECVLP